MGRTEACRWTSDRPTKSIGHARSWSQAKGSGRGVRLSPISTTTSSTAAAAAVCEFRGHLAETDSHSRSEFRPRSGENPGSAHEHVADLENRPGVEARDVEHEIGPDHLDAWVPPVGVAIDHRGPR